MKSSNQKIGRNFVWFCVGIACGIFISIILFLGFASPSVVKQIWSHSSKDQHSNPAAIEVRFNSPSDSKDGMVVHERKLSQDNSISEQDSNGNLSIPIEAQQDVPPVENPLWEQSLTPLHIPGYLTQELNLKKKVFVAIVHPNIESNPVFDLVFETWGKGWASKGNGDITLYSPIGLNVKKSEGVNIYRLSVSSPNVNEISPTMIFQTLTDICSQHIDTHHHFYIVNSNTYVNLPMLLNFTNRLDDSTSLWIGKRKKTDDKDKMYTNDPNFYCSVGPGFLLTRHALQRLCPYLSTCQLKYTESEAPTGVQLARCVLRFLNQTCTYTTKDIFYEAPSKELVDPYSEKCPFKESISVHPIGDEYALMKLHHFFLARRLNETKKLNEYYHNIIQGMDRVLVQEGGMADDRLILGREGNANKYQHGDVISWDKIEMADGGGKNIYIADGPEPSRDLTKADEEVLNKVTSLALKKMKEEFDIDNGLTISSTFRRVVPGVGFQYMVDVKKNSEEIATVFIDQPYDRMRALSTHFAPNVKVNFVLPLQDGSPHFKEFMQMFEQACMSVDRAKNVALLVVLYFSKNNESKQIDERHSESLNLLNLYKQKYPDLSLRWIDGGSELLSHIEGMLMAIRALPADTLMCSTSLFIRMSPEFLHHARLNTVPGERLFFPAPFQEFDSDGMNVHEISKYSGFWRSFDYSFFCGYKQDIIRACGGEAFSSGADLYERALSSGLDVFRAPEHSLAVKWHERDCQSSLLSREEKTSCEVETKNVNLFASSLRH